MKKFKEYICELKKTDRGKAILKLSGYLTFFIAVLLLVSITNALNAPKTNYTPDNGTENTSGVNNNEDSIPVSGEIKPKTYLEKQEKLYNEDYSYNFRITGEINLLYRGDYTKGIHEGYKESNDKTMRYRIEQDKTYEIKLEKKIEIDNLYQGLDSTLFDLKTVFTKLNSKSTIIDREEDSKSYTYENVEGYKYVIYMTETEITKIVINNEHLNYEFTFEY